MDISGIRTRVGLIALAVGIVATCSGTAPGGHGHRLGDAAESQACWLEVDTGHEACAANPRALAELIASRYSSRIEGPASEPEAGAPFALPSAPSGSAPLTSTYILGAHYFDADFSGTSRTITESVEPNPCDQPGSYVFGFEGNLGGWDNQISSFEGFGHCGFRFFADSNFAGSAFGPAGATARLGAFNDQASSFDTHKVD